jgi:hypothetical protein
MEKGVDFGANFMWKKGRDEGVGPYWLKLVKMKLSSKTIGQQNLLQG